MSVAARCPQCQFDINYPNQHLLVYTQCFHEWDPATVVEEGTNQVIDANGNVLQNGDTVVIIKDLP